MPYKEIDNTRIKSVDDLKPIINEIQEDVALDARQNKVEFYRGQESDSFKLINGVARFDGPRDNLLEKERELFETYLSKIDRGEITPVQDPYFQDRYDYIKEWHHLFQAQHSKLKTRLMDWSADWKKALLFAVDDEKGFGQDGQFWILLCPRGNVINDGDLNSIYDTYPLGIGKSFMINSPFFQDIEGNDYSAERRRERQHGRFFIQPDELCLTPLEEQEYWQDHLIKLVIDGDSKESIKKELNDAGLTIDWLYYRSESNIDEKLKCLNDQIMGR